METNSKSFSLRDNQFRPGRIESPRERGCVRKTCRSASPVRKGVKPDISHRARNADRPERRHVVGFGRSSRKSRLQTGAPVSPV